MSSLRRGFVWAPRILALFYGCFLALFALDVFSDPRGLGETLLALLMHMLPSFVVFAVVAAAWKRDLIGTGLFGLLGLAYVATTWNRFQLEVYLLIAGPLFLLAVLYALAWRMRRDDDVSDPASDGP